MSIIARIDNLGNIGVKEYYNPWEIYLTRKLNFLSFVGIINVSASLVFFVLMGLNDFILECILTIVIGSFVPVLNSRKNYIWAGYLFYFIGIVLFYVIALKMGFETMVVLYYFPILISLVQIFGRKETLKHLFIIAFLFFISIVVLVIGYNNQFLRLELTEETLQTLKLFNIISSFFLTTALLLFLTLESIKQETMIKSMLNDKEILLAEVFHRVKNNMNIVTSLLNLKKNASKSEETQLALEECRMRVFSMALVHQKIYSGKKINSLNLKEYINELISESINSLGGKEKVDIKLNSDETELHLNHAIPCGLILNELITNSFKYAQLENRKLLIEVELRNIGIEISLKVKDNGPGFDIEAVSKDSLGLEIIRSLSEQLDAKYSFSNNNGSVFEMSFNKG